MTSQTMGDHADQTPNFELPRHGAIREDNWPEYQAKGFQPLIFDDLEFAQIHYGVEHVYTGDAYDYEAERPLRHKPGTGVYVDPEGLVIGAKKQREWQQWLDEHGFGQEPDGGPGAS